MKGFMLWGRSCCTTMAGMAESSMRGKPRAAGRERERQGNAVSQEHPTHSCCLLLSPQSEHVNTLGGGRKRKDTEKQM